MKFIVREGFVIHLIKVVEIQGKPTQQSSSYYEGETVDFEAADAAANLHKLEPADKEAKAFCQARFAPVQEAPVPGINQEQLAALIAAAVASALQQQASQASAPAAAPAASGSTGA